MKNKQYIYVLSSMRAGSTLLKSLLATRKEIADLPEIPVQLADEIASFTPEPMILIKRPKNYPNINYPYFQFRRNSKIIVLIRNPYDTILSLHKMNLENHFHNIHWYNEERLLDYWIATYYSLIKNIDFQVQNVHLVRYEDLTQSPVATTEAIFKFLGTSDTSGTNTYSNPKGYPWKWGFGDGGDVLKQLKIVYKQSKGLNKKLLNLIDKSDAVQQLLTNYGYKNSPAKSGRKKKNLAGLMTLIYPRMELDHIEEWIAHHAFLGINYFWICNHSDFVQDPQFGDYQTETWTKKPGANYNLHLDNKEVQDHLNNVLNTCRAKYSVDISLIPVQASEYGVAHDQVMISEQIVSLAKEQVEWLGFFDVDELIVGNLQELLYLAHDTAIVTIFQKVFDNRWKDHKPVAMKSIVSHYGVVEFNNKIFARTNRVSKWGPSVHYIDEEYRTGKVATMSPDLLRFHHFRGIDVPAIETTHPNNLSRYARLTLKEETDNSHTLVSSSTSSGL